MLIVAVFTLMTTLLLSEDDRTIEGRRIVLKDRHGHARIELDADPEGSGSRAWIVLYDEAGRRRFLGFADQDGAGISIGDDQGRIRGTFFVNPKDPASIWAEMKTRSSSWVFRGIRRSSVFPVAVARDPWN